MMTWRTWGVPVRCGVGMVALQTLLALYRFGDTTAWLQLVNPLMWIGLGLFFVTGWVIGWVVERLLRRCRHRCPSPHAASARSGW